jgi:hypothetical protein
MALAALCALVHCPVQPATSTPIVEHFPLGQALSLRVTESTDKVGTWHAAPQLHGCGGKCASGAHLASHMHNHWNQALVPPRQ